MKKGNMRFSVAMCTYNGERFLAEQLQSFAAQQRLPDELVVCDDRSTDGTMALLESFAASAPFSVRIIQNERNLGFSQNFAKAIRLCEGDLIALSDQDDIWYPEKLKRLEEAFALEPGREGVFSNGDILDDASRNVGSTLWSSFHFSLRDQKQFRLGGQVHQLLRRNVVTGMTLAVRRSAADLLDPMPASWMHDGWLAMLIAVRSGLFACPDRLVGYRVHHTQQAGTPPTTAIKLRLLRKGLFGYAAWVRARNLDEHQRTAAQFEDLYAVLVQRGLGDERLRREVRAKSEHARRGEQALQRSRLTRWSRLLAHAHSYARYSPNGMRGLVRDLLV